MGEFIKIKHSFNAGDAITILPGLRQIYKDTGRKIQFYQFLDFPAFYYENQINSTIDKEGNSVCMNDVMFCMMKPLIETQEYIHSFDVWKGEKVDLDYDLTRDSRATPLPAGLIHSWPEVIFPETATDLSKAWIKVDNSSEYKKNIYKNKFIINRTERYQNPYISYYFLKQYEDKIIFSGTDVEYGKFCKQWNVNIEKLVVMDFIELAQVISWCKFGIFNQSFNFHLADAMKTKRILELCTNFPNTFITGANGHQFYRQAHLEFVVNKLINEN